MIVASNGTFCTGVAIALDLILTAAHCVTHEAEYKLIEFSASGQPVLLGVNRVVRHPKFDLKSLLGHRATSDIALVKLAAPLSASVSPAALRLDERRPQAGDRYTVTGYGVSIRGDPKSSGTLRRAQLVATGRPGNLQVRLVDPVTQGAKAGLGACTGDSGAPVYQDTKLVGVVSWSTGPNLETGCGGLTGVTPLTIYLRWIIDTAHRLGSSLSP